MEKVIQQFKQLVDSKESNEEREIRLNELKPEINNLLWEYLPEDTTMKEAEAIAFTIFMLITEHRNFIKNNRA